MSCINSTYNQRTNIIIILGRIKTVKYTLFVFLELLGLIGFRKPNEVKQKHTSTHKSSVSL